MGCCQDLSDVGRDRRCRRWRWRSIGSAAGPMDRWAKSLPARGPARLCGLWRSSRRFRLEPARWRGALWCEPCGLVAPWCVWRLVWPVSTGFFAVVCMRECVLAGLGAVMYCLMFASSALSVHHAACRVLVSAGSGWWLVVVLSSVDFGRGCFLEDLAGLRGAARGGGLGVVVVRSGDGASAPQIFLTGLVGRFRRS